jgi:thioredoxin-dependent peroxiredoxin
MCHRVFVSTGRHPNGRRRRRAGVRPGSGGRDHQRTDEELHMGTLAVGDKAPAFTLPDQNGKPVSLKDFKGSPLVVYFYPRDDTPGCTKEACQFNDNLQAFKKAKVAVVGISADPPATHRAFRSKYGLRFPLLTDEGHKVGTAYGAWGEKTLYGKKSVGVIRSTFLIGANGKIDRAWYHVKADGHAAKVLDEIES